MTDALSAISYLRTERAGLVQGIGILGVSQGGYIAPLVATGSCDLALAINAAGGAIPRHDVLLYEENNNLRQMGLLPVFSNAIAYPSTYYIRSFSQRDFWSADGNFDPLPYWREVDMPALILYGDKDTNVPSDQSGKRLDARGKHNRAWLYSRARDTISNRPMASLATTYARTHSS